MPIALTVTEGPHRGEVFTFRDHDTFLVGRSPDVHFSLPERDPYFSRVHFMIEVNPPLCRLVDLRSRNGTFVNGQRVTAADLRDGDAIQAGTTTLRVTLVPEAKDVAVTLSQPAAAVGTPLVPGRPTAPAPTLPRGEDLYATPFPTPSAATSVSPAGLPAVPGYRLQWPLGEGGMGVVYLARREADGALAAVKTIRPAVQASEQTVARFLREADILRVGFQRAPGDEGGGDEVVAAVGADLEDGNDVRVAEVGGRLGLAQEALHPLRAAELLGLGHLEGDGAVELRVVRLVDAAERSLAQEPTHREPADLFRQGLHRGGRRLDGVGVGTGRASGGVRLPGRGPAGGASRRERQGGAR
jgi:hypothetical protein